MCLRCDFIAIGDNSTVFISENSKSVKQQGAPRFELIDLYIQFGKYFYFFHQFSSVSNQAKRSE